MRCRLKCLPGVHLFRWRLRGLFHNGGAEGWLSNGVGARHPASGWWYYGWFGCGCNHYRSGVFSCHYSHSQELSAGRSQFSWFKEGNTVWRQEADSGITGVVDQNAFNTGITSSSQRTQQNEYCHWSLFRDFSSLTRVWSMWCKDGFLQWTESQVCRLVATTRQNCHWGWCIMFTGNCPTGTILWQHPFRGNRMPTMERFRRPGTNEWWPQ